MAVCVLHQGRRCAAEKCVTALSHGHQVEVSARLAAGHESLPVSTLILCARYPTPASTLSTHPPAFSSPFLLSTLNIREFLREFFFRRVNYLIVILDSKACRCNIQLLKPLDL